jgi:predicted transcriptional regulator
VKSLKSGLAARTKVLNVLDKHLADATAISQETLMSYYAVMYHLRLLKTEGTVCRKGKRPFIWKSTGIGQKRLVA